MESYSILVRLQRTTVEYAYVGVPVVGDIMLDEPQPDGTYRIDPEKMTAATLALEHNSGVIWYSEGVQIQMHPLQKPLEPEEKAFYGHEAAGSEIE